ncbi:MAG: serpin family protein [Phycisphaerae bacterium]|nr:serpin family protein [Phycisphaerae bacterium]
MRRSLIGIALLSLASGCYKETTPWETFGAVGQTPPPSTQNDQAADLKALVEGNTVFALNLYAQLARSDGNLSVSPQGVSRILAMAYAGAHGNTAKEIAKVAHFGLPPGRLHPTFGRLRSELKALAGRGGMELRYADAIWMQRDRSFKPAFQELIQKDYDANLKRVDFLGEHKAVLAEINAWVEQQTGGRIKGFLEKGDVDALTLLAITNAICFHGKWARPFDAQCTQNLAFRLSAKQGATAATMSQSGTFGYMETGNLQVIELPYADGELSMLVLLPKKAGDLRRVEAMLTPANLSAWSGRLIETSAQVFLPRFTIGAKFRLHDTLSDMGMFDAFNLSSDFSGIDIRRKLYVKQFMHAAEVAVDEGGSAPAAEPAGEASVVFRADHPFLFLIQHKPTKAILFMGRVMNPTSGPGTTAPGGS